MRYLRLGAVLLLGAALLPEPGRYWAERELFRVSSALRILVGDPGQVPDRARALDWVAATAAGLVEKLPGDARPLLVAGAARLVGGQPRQALVYYRQALERGERAEITLNIARARAALGDQDAARAALIRALWLTPALVAALPEPPGGAASAEVKRLAAELAAGRPAAPPALRWPD
ncbi:MAG: hypothetical protein V1750_01805 [Acidobacteriota bacterium]